MLRYLVPPDSAVAMLPSPYGLAGEKMGKVKPRVEGINVCVRVRPPSTQEEQGNRQESHEEDKCGVFRHATNLNFTSSDSCRARLILVQLSLPAAWGT